MKTVSAEPSAIMVIARGTTRRRPNFWVSAAANGPASPNSTRLTDTAPAIVARDQPNSSCSGTIRTPGVARKPAAKSRQKKSPAATTQAGWTRRSNSPRGSRLGAGWVGGSMVEPALMRPQGIVWLMTGTHDVRDRLSRAAYELLREGGLAGASPAQVAERAGASKMSLYRHFSGIDE